MSYGTLPQVRLSPDTADEGYLYHCNLTARKTKILLKSLIQIKGFRIQV